VLTLFFCKDKDKATEAKWMFSW